MDWLAVSAEAHPDAPAVITDARTVTYGELDRAADGVASMISASGSLDSSAVAFWGDRSIETVAAVWGIPRAGVTAVAVDPGAAPADAMGATRAAGVRGLWVTPEGGFDRLLDRGARAAATTWPDVPYVVFTSGTEGNPKGVLLTDDNLTASVAGSRERLGNGLDDAWLCVLPLFRVGGLSILWRQAESGAPVVLLDRFDPTVAAAALDGVIFASFVPVMLRRILDIGREWTDLAAVLVGGAAADDPLITTARAAGIPAVPTYGMTETCSQIATASSEEPLDGSVGLPLSGAEIRVTAGGVPVVGAEGRIEVRGPMVSPGYVGEPGRSVGDWFTTGDVGLLDHDGRLTVLGRADSVIVSGGENIHPGRVERLLGDHPGIAGVSVSGTPDEDWGMVVTAVVVLENTTLAEVESWAERTLAPAARPRIWRVVDRADLEFED